MPAEYPHLARVRTAIAVAAAISAILWLLIVALFWSAF